MFQTDDELADLLLWAQTQAGGTIGNSERRRYERIPKCGSMVIFPCHGQVLGKSMRVMLRDLSRCGLGFSSQAKLEIGSVFVLGLRRGTGKVTVLLYTIRRSRQLPTPGGFLVGAELVCSLREGDLVQSLDDSPMHRVGRVLLGLNPIPMPISPNTAVAEHIDTITDL